MEQPTSDRDGPSEPENRGKKRAAKKAQAVRVKKARVDTPVSRSCLAKNPLLTSCSFQKKPGPERQE